jgi:TolB-like protein
LSKIFFITILLIFTGCGITSKFPYFEGTKVTDFKTPTEKLVSGMKDKLLSISPRILNKHIYVVDFVNVKNLDVTSQLGPSLSLEVKSHISKMFNYRIKELEYMKYFKISENGAKLSSRDLNDIMNDTDRTYALVGSYLITDQQLMMYLKLIDMKTGDILSTTSQSIAVTDEILNMERNVQKDENVVSGRPRLVL